MPNRGALYLTTGAKIDLDELSETTRVVVLHGLSVTKGLQYRVGVNHLLFKALSAFNVVLDPKEILTCRLELILAVCEVAHHDLCCLRLPGAALTSDDDRLRFSIDHQILVGLLSHQKRVRRDLPSRALALGCNERPVLLGSLKRVDRQRLVRVE